MAKPKDKDLQKDSEITSDEQVIASVEEAEKIDVEIVSTISESTIDLSDQLTELNIPEHKQYPSMVQILKKFKCQVSNRPNSSVMLTFKEGQIINDEHLIKILIDNSCPVKPLFDNNSSAVEV